MKRSPWRARTALAVLTALVASAQAQQPYIGYVYPAGGRQGTTFIVTLGGQTLEGVKRVYVSGAGVRARLFEYNKRLNNQELSLLNEQLKELRALPKDRQTTPITNLAARLQRYIGDYVNSPACMSIADQVLAEVTIAPDVPL